MLGVPFLDDSVDRLNYLVTPTILLFFALMVSAKQFVGSPIRCLSPIEFHHGWKQFAEDYCFIQNTYYVPFGEEIPEDTEDREKAQFAYYQWVPFVLVLQAIMFYAPHWMWKILNKRIGVDIAGAVIDARKLSSLSAEPRREGVLKLAESLAESIDMEGGLHKQYRFFFLRFGNFSGSFVSTLYLYTKVANIHNLFLQFVIIDGFIGAGDLLWGFRTHESTLFPRVTLCDISICEVANYTVHDYTVQCVLMINTFNEKIYLFLWFWFVALLVVTVINFVYCWSQMILTRARVRSVEKWLGGTFKEPMTMHDDVMIRRFALSALQPDGILVLRFIERHAGAAVAKEIAVALYEEFLDLQQSNSTPISTSNESLDEFELQEELETVLIEKPNYKSDNNPNIYF